MMPVLVLFEYHADRIPKLLLQEALPNLARRGYTTYCIEGESVLSEEEICQGLRERIEEGQQVRRAVGMQLQERRLNPETIFSLPVEKLVTFCRLVAPQENHLRMVWSIKLLAGYSMIQANFLKAKQLDMQICGIDDPENLEAIGEDPSIESLPLLKAVNEKREDAFAENIVQRKSRGENLIFACGAAHAAGLLKRLKARYIEVLAYYPHHSSDPEIVGGIGASIPTLQRPLNIDEISAYGNTLIRTIDFHTRYVEKVETINTARLSQRFKIRFDGHLRDNYDVDALMKVTSWEKAGEVETEMQKLALRTYLVCYKKVLYLAVAAVNDPANSLKISKSA